MTAPFTLAGDFEDALVEALKARFAVHATLSGVYVESGPGGDSAEAGDKFVVGVDEGDEATIGDVDWWASGGYGMREEIVIHCEAVGFSEGAGPDHIRAARDRAHAICAEVRDELLEAAQPGSNHPILAGGRVKMLRIAGWRERRYVDRASRIQIDIGFTGDLPNV